MFPEKKWLSTYFSEFKFIWNYENLHPIEYYFKNNPDKFLFFSKMIYESE